MKGCTLVLDVILAVLLTITAAIATDRWLEARSERDRADACERGRVCLEWEPR